MTDTAAGEVRDGYDAWKALDAQERAATAAHWAVIDHNGVLILRCACGWHAGTLFDAAKHDQEAHDGT